VLEKFEIRNSGNQSAPLILSEARRMDDDATDVEEILVERGAIILNIDKRKHNTHQHVFKFHDVSAVSNPGGIRSFDVAFVRFLSADDSASRQSLSFLESCWRAKTIDTAAQGNEGYDPYCRPKIRRRKMVGRGLLNLSDEVATLRYRG
jgi:hypothetical protein